MPSILMLETFCYDREKEIYEKMKEKWIKAPHLPLHALLAVD